MSSVTEKPLLQFQLYAFDQSYILSDAPIGWDESSFVEKISDRYKVLAEDFDTTFKFVFEGANILRKALYSQGQKAKAKLKILELNTSTQEYEEIVFQDLDFSETNDDIEGFSIKLNDNGIKANLNSFQDTAYSIPVDDTTNAITVNIGGVGVTEYGVWAGTFFNSDPIYNDGTVYFGNRMIPEMTISDETLSPDFITINTYTGGNVNYRGTPVSRYFATIQNNFDLRIQGQVIANLPKYRLGDPDPGLQTVKFAIVDQFNTQYVLGSAWGQGRQTPPYDDIPQGAIVVDFDITISVVAGQQLHFEFQFKDNNYDQEPDEFPHYFPVISSLLLRVDYSALTSDYIGKALKGFDLFKALMAKMNPNINVTCKSNLLQNSEWNRLIFMSGDNIRGFRDGVITTSFSDFFASIDAELLTGLDIYGTTAELESLPDFFNPYVQLADIGEVSKAIFSFDKTKIASEIQVGYADQEYNKVNGRDEYNTTSIFTSKDSILVGKKDITSRYRTDARGVDQLIIDFRDNPTTDSRADTQIWMFKIASTAPIDNVYLFEGVSAYKSVSGTSALGNAYNIDLSPRRMLYRNSPLLAVQYALEKTGQLDFQSSKKNAELTTTDFNDVTVKEKDSLTYDQMKSAMGLPIVASVTTSLTSNKYKEIKVNRLKRGYIKFYVDGKSYKGFIVENAFDLVTKDEKNLKLWLTLDNDLFKLRTKANG